MGSQNSYKQYLFYDLETSGTNPSFDQILQFAGVKTDLSFNEIERYEFRIKLRNDVIPEPGALIVNRLNIDKIIVGESESILSIMKMIDKVAQTDARVLITGPNGVGKELVAKQLHEKSNRSQLEFIEVNCAAIPSELIESELFGHEKGSFTSAHKQKAGKFEKANGGTLFLDEVGDMPPEAQPRLLRVLQDGEYLPVGKRQAVKTNIRIIAATNQ